MEFRKLITERHSVRAYKETVIPHEDLVSILKAAQLAPSWKNWQASRCYVVQTPEKLEELRTEALPEFNRRNAKNAVLVVTTFVRGLVGHTAGVPDNELGDKWGAYDLGLHDAYMILAAKDAGYDSLIMGIRDAKKVREVLEIPEEEEIVSVIAIGKAAQNPAPKARRELEEVAAFL